MHIPDEFIFLESLVPRLNVLPQTLQATVLLLPVPVELVGVAGQFHQSISPIKSRTIITVITSPLVNFLFNIIHL